MPLFRTHRVRAWVQVQASAVREDAADALGQEGRPGAAGEWEFWSGNHGIWCRQFGCRCKSRRTTDGLFKALGKEEVFPMPMAEENRNQEEPAMVRPAEGFTKPEQQAAGPGTDRFEIPVKAQTRTARGNGQPEEELPLAHAADSQQAVQPKDYGIAGQAGTQSPVRTSMEELPEAFAKTLADRLPERDSTLTIEFEPASLGKVTLRVSMKPGTSVSLMSDNPKTLEILSQNAGQIAGILEDKTGRDGDLHLSVPAAVWGIQGKAAGKAAGSPVTKDDRRRGSGIHLPSSSGWALYRQEDLKRWQIMFR